MKIFLCFYKILYLFISVQNSCLKKNVFVEMTHLTKIMTTNVYYMILKICFHQISCQRKKLINLEGI